MRDGNGVDRRRPPSSSRTQKGSALIVSMITMAILAILAVSAVRLSMQGVVNSSRKVAYDELVACANAAYQKVLAEFMLSGASGSITATTVPGGPILGLGHYDDSLVVTINPTNSAQQQSNIAGATGGEGDSMFPNATNRLDDANQGVGGFGTRLFSAHCTDSQGRQQEVEILVNIGLR